MRSFAQATCLDAWRAVAGYLLGVPGKSDFNVVVSIANLPTVEDEAWLRRFDPRVVRQGADRAQDVANTIFPAKTWSNAGERPAFYQRYQRAAQHGRRRHPAAWGTYFSRLINFGAKRVNQLERVIHSINAWRANHRAAFVLHLASPETDAPRSRGGPCLQYVQVLCPTSSSIALVAIYRSHDYFNKALANYVGLGRLLSFICEATDRTPAGLVCHSVSAFYDVPNETMRALLAR
jgi:thymidylate synthase